MKALFRVGSFSLGQLINNFKLITASQLQFVCCHNSSTYDLILACFHWNLHASDICLRLSSSVTVFGRDIISNLIDEAIWNVDCRLPNYVRLMPRSCIFWLSKKFLFDKLKFFPSLQSVSAEMTGRRSKSLEIIINQQTDWKSGLSLSSFLSICLFRPRFYCLCAFRFTSQTS